MKKRFKINHMATFRNTKSISTRLVLLTFLLTAMMLIVTIACKKNLESEIHIGAVYPLTGPRASVGQASINGIQLAAEDMNKNGGVKGKKINIVAEDGQGNPAASVSAFNKLVEIDGIRIVIVLHSSPSLAIIPISQQKGVLVLSEATHPKITESRPLVLRHAVTTQQEISAIIDHISQYKKSIKKISHLYLNDDYGQALEKNLENIISQKGGLTLVSKEHYEPEEKDFNTILNKILVAGPDAVIIGGSGRGVGDAIKRIREFGYRGAIYTTTGLTITSDAITAAGEAIQGVYTLKFTFEQSEEYRVFSARYKERYGEAPTSTAMLDYASLQLLCYAIEKVGDDPSNIYAYFQTPQVFKVITGNVAINNGVDFLSPIEVTQY